MVSSYILQSRDTSGKYTQLVNKTGGLCLLIQTPRWLKKKKTSRSQVGHNVFVFHEESKRAKVMALLLLKARAGGVGVKSSYSVLLASLSKDLVRETGHARVPREVWGLN